MGNPAKATSKPQKFCLLFLDSGGLADARTILNKAFEPTASNASEKWFMRMIIHIHSLTWFHVIHSLNSSRGGVLWWLAAILFSPAPQTDDSNGVFNEYTTCSHVRTKNGFDSGSSCSWFMGYVSLVPMFDSGVMPKVMPSSVSA